MEHISKTEFRKLSSVELGRDGVLEVRSHGAVVGVWVPRSEWKRRLIECRLYREALQDIVALRNESINADDLLAQSIEIAQRALNAHQRAHSNGGRPERRPVAPLFGEEVEG